ncbi:MAG: butyrate kinase [Candidatus Kapabacteria bacterium]|nr:butyrate kinase [Ignavibacteriota bacterium]MCW5884706.1 butyrate kinase [Candidatus Kapabacteria bacterium]
MKILAINPGSTSTKIAVFDDLVLKYDKSLRHSVEDLQGFNSIIEQYEFRKNCILDFLSEQNDSPKSIDIFVGRGGLVKPIPGGVYKVNESLLRDLRKGIMGEHASNLGGILAFEIAKSAGKEDKSYIVDPVVVDELDEIARFSGRPEMPRVSIFHALNQKAVARRFAREHGKKYEELSLIVVHLGGGITVGVHKNGRVIDVNNGLDGEGPFSPERTGSLPVGSLIKLCFSGKYQLHEVRKMITGAGGMVSYLGTNNGTEVEKRIENEDHQAQMVYLAMAYQVAKEIGACATVLSGRIDAILITGGLAYSELLTKWINKRVAFLAPVHIYPGEDEMQALTEGVYYATKGEIPIKNYI